MATGTVSSVTGDVWQLIASNTPTTSPTEIVFSSISGYKTIMVVYKGITTGGTSSLSFKCNADGTTGNYAGGNSTGTENAIILVNNSSSTRGGFAIVYDVDKSIAHKVDVAVVTNVSTTQAYVNPVPITSITAYAAGQTFTGGTIYLYGIAA